MFYKKTSHSFKTSLDKEISYIHAVITEPVTITCRKFTFELKPIKTFVISPLLFERWYSCMNYPGCSCCSGFWNFTQKQLACKDMTGDELIISFNSNPISYFMNSFEGKPCPFNVSGCLIHRTNPITCMFPLIQFRRNKKQDSVTLTKTYFGRNWLLGCPAQFTPYKDINHFRDDVMWKFEYFKQYMDNTKVKHRLTWMIQEIEQKAKLYFNGDRKKWIRLNI